MRIYSLVGLIPLLAVETIEPDLLRQLPTFGEVVEHTMESRPELAGLVSRWSVAGSGERRLLSLLRGHRMKCLLKVAFDEERMLSPHGIRSVSREHLDDPFRMNFAGREVRVDYEPAESRTTLFGGNSNWRGPVWFPVNVLLLESMLKFHHYYGDDFRIEVPRERPPGHDPGCRRSPPAKAGLALPAGRRRWPTDLRAGRAVPPAGVAGSSPVLRVLLRRHRTRVRCDAPDRLDGARRQVARSRQHSRGQGGSSALNGVSGPRTGVVWGGFPRTGRR